VEWPHGGGQIGRGEARYDPNVGFRHLSHGKCPLRSVASAADRRAGATGLGSKVGCAWRYHDSDAPFRRRNSVSGGSPGTSSGRRPAQARPRAVAMRAGQDHHRRSGPGRHPAWPPRAEPAVSDRRRVRVRWPCSSWVPTAGTANAACTSPSPLGAMAVAHPRIWRLL
jgi:hypothetical protein